MTKQKYTPGPWRIDPCKDGNGSALLAEMAKVTWLK